jgi:hypothetical protein
MKFHGEDQSFLGDILLRVSAAGIFAYSAFNVVAGGLGVHSDLRNILVLAVGGITIIQVRFLGGLFLTIKLILFCLEGILIGFKLEGTKLIFRIIFFQKSSVF